MDSALPACLPLLAQFWQQINVSSSPEWLELCLTRCAGTPATIIVWHSTQLDATLFATLRRFVSSVGEIYVHSYAPDVASLAGLMSFLDTPLPALESLSLRGVFHDKTAVDVEIAHALVPRLSSLELYTCTIPRNTGLYIYLRNLSLSGCMWTLSYGDFLDMLSKCHALEDLTLDGDILDSFANQVGNLAMKYPALALPVALPRLKSVRLSGQRNLLFHLLANMHVPQARTFALTNCLDDDEPGPLVTRLLAPAPHVRIPFLSSPRVILLRCWDEAPFLLHIYAWWCRRVRAFLPRLRDAVNNELWSGNSYLEHNLVAIMDTFSVASVHTLEIEGYLEEVAVETWQRVFKTFSGLRTLRLKGMGTLDTLWLGLSRASAASLERDGAVCCPALSDIGIDDRSHFVSHVWFTATEALFKILPETLRARADAGGTRLRKLQLHFRYPDELLRQSSALRGTFIEHMRTLVDELDYQQYSRT